MEPRPHERGKLGMPPKRSRAILRFNGATSSRTWKAVNATQTKRRQRKLQWSHVLTNVESRLCVEHVPAEPARFNGATSSRTWKEYFTRKGCLLCRRSFNGATSSRTWKEADGVSQSECTFASMEPRPHERGKDDTWEVECVEVVPASMEPRPHERGKALFAILAHTATA